MFNTTIGRRLDRRILKYAFSKRMPLIGIALIELRRFISNRPLKKSLIPDKSWVGFVSKLSGYAFIKPETFTQTPLILKACNEIYETYLLDTQSTTKPNKKYFFNIARIEDLKTHPALMNFALSKELISIATDYIPSPRLHSIGVFLSTVNDSVSGSQLFHIDGDCLKQLKCFINIWNVGEDSGPLTFLPASSINWNLRNRGLIKDLDDADLDKLIGGSPPIIAVGPAGSGVFCDTSRCLHQGSRAKKNARLILCIQYVTRPDALIENGTINKKAGGHILVNQELLKFLGLRNEEYSTYVD